MTDSTTPAVPADAIAARRRPREKCGACGGAWFGEVAYCPYCGRASAGEPAAMPVDVAPAPTDPVVASKPAEPAEPGDSWLSWAKPLAAGALLGVLLVVLAALVLRFFG